MLIKYTLTPTKINLTYFRDTVETRDARERLLLLRATPALQ